MKKEPKLGPELFYVDANGKKADADLHSEMLELDPETEASRYAATKARLKKTYGWSDDVIDAGYMPKSMYAAGGAVTAGRKIKRDAFLYMDPKSPKDSFAQCGTCLMFTGTGCTILGKTKITKDMTCGLYVRGKPQLHLKGKEQSLVTPKEAGLVDIQVRCENCRYGGGDCGLFKTLNDKLPDMFDLDVKIDPKGCCNGFTKKGS